MNAEEVKRLITDEVQGREELANVHGITLERLTEHLVYPEKQEFDTFEEDKTLPLWLVLEENPTERNGYKGVYDENEKLFGLAICGTPHGVFIGYYGSFLETLEGM